LSSARCSGEEYPLFQHPVPSCIFQFSSLPVYSMMHRTSQKRPHALRFIDYLRMLPSALVFERFLNNTNRTRRKILSSNAIQEGVRRFCRVETLRRQFASLCPEDKLACSLTYLHGARGLSADTVGGDDPLNHPLVGSFLVYAGRNACGEIRYFCFPEFEPGLRQLCAKTIADAGAVNGYLPKDYSFFKGIPSAASRQNDMTIVAILAMQGVLEKKKQGGLTRDALHAVASLTHAGQDCPADLLLFCGIKAGILLCG
jgi:hypothetical protein